MRKLYIEQNRCAMAQQGCGAVYLLLQKRQLITSFVFIVKLPHKTKYKTGFPAEYFSDHKLENYADYFQVLFELEDILGLTVAPTENGKFILTCNDVTFESYLRTWYQKKMDLKTGKCSKEEYDIWCARFPISVADDMHAEMRNLMKQNKEDE